jgi:hypothetical protein
MQEFIDAAFYTRNVPTWERTLRLLIGIGLVGLGLWRGQPLMLVLSLASAVSLVATASTGFCPACYLFGRRVLSRRSGA